MRANRSSDLRRNAGRTLLELTIATTAMVGVLSGAVPAFNAITKHGDEGTSRTYVESDNRQALLRISRELMNTSTSQLHPVTGTQIVRITQDSAAGYLVMNSGCEAGADAFGGPGDDGEEMAAAGAYPGGSTLVPPTAGQYGWTVCAGCAGGLTRSHTCGLADGTLNVSGGTYGATPLNPAKTGSGRRGKTAAARTWGTTPTLHGSRTFRPRLRNFGNTANSQLVFNKVSGFSIAVTGEPVITWSTDITYRVIGRQLVREQDGRRAVVSSNVSRFVVEQTNDNTVLVTLVTERRARSTSEVTRQSNQIEVEPKN